MDDKNSQKTEDKMADAPVKKKLWKRDWFQRVLMLFLILLLGLAAAGYAVLEREVSPRFVFETCMDWYGTGNLDALWEEASYPESGMITKEIFEEWCMKGRESNLLSYEYKREKNGRALVYHVTFLEEESAEEKKVDIELVPSGERKYLIFPIYRYSIDGLIAKDVEIIVISGCTVTLDGRPLDDYFTKSEDGYDYYTIPELLKGSWHLSVTSNVVDSVDMEFVVEKDHDFYKMDENTQLSEANKQELFETVQGLVYSMYKDLMDQEGLSLDDFVASEEVAVSENGLKELDKVYQAVKGQLYFGEDEIVVDNFHNMQEKELTVSKFVYPDSAEIKYRFIYDYEGKGNYDIILGERIEAKGRREIVLNTAFINDANQWKINKINLSCKELELPEESDDNS